ncbi:MAG: hypothetical protein GX080_07005 [Tissierellia bacterium]|nr:hypothetical protein [Tissierellia bacterium]
MDRLGKLTDDQLLDRIDKEIDKLNILLEQDNIDQYNRAKFEVNQLIVEAKKRNVNLEKSELINKILLTD